MNLVLFILPSFLIFRCFTLQEFLTGNVLVKTQPGGLLCPSLHNGDLRKLGIYYCKVHQGYVHVE